MKFRYQRQDANLRASEINRWNRTVRAVQRGEASELPNGLGYNPSSRVAYCENTTGSDRDRYECMSITGMAWDLEQDGSTGLLFEAGEADPDKPPIVLVTPIPAGQAGLAVVDGIALALVEGDATTKDFGTPDPATHSISPDSSGGIRLLTEPHDTDQKLLAVILNAGLGGGSTTFYSYSLTSDMAWSTLNNRGEGTATVEPLGGGTATTGQTLVDPAETAAHQISGDGGVCIQQGSEYWIIEPECNFGGYDPEPV